MKRELIKKGLVIADDEPQWALADHGVGPVFGINF